MTLGYAAIFFYVLAGMALAAAVMVVTQKNPVHSAMFLVFAFFCVAGFYVTMSAEFLAAVQVLLYAGGVVTIAVFAIVVTERLVGDRITQTSRYLASGVIAAGLLLVVLLTFIRSVRTPASPPAMIGDFTRAIGQAVLTRWVLAFELLGVLFLAALLGALYFARPDD